MYFDDHRLKRAVRLIMYFSTVLPGKFLTAFRHNTDGVFEKILRLGQ